MLSSKISIAFMTNCTKNAPDIKTQKHTIQSLYAKFNIDHILPTIVFVDKKPNHPAYKNYVENLKTISEFKNAKFIDTKGLPDGYLQLLDIIETPYVFFLEHDWSFKNITTSLHDVLSWMDKDTNINAILFNKRVNRIAGDDKVLIKHPIYSLTLTNRQSNNPHIFRVDHAKYIKGNLLMRKEGCSIHPLVSDNCQGIECEFQNYVGKNIDKIKLFGTFLYGSLGNPPTITHLDGKR